MALTITATVGSASANSFVTESEVITYMAARLNATTWTTTTGSTCTETEKAALIEATRDLSGQSWQGTRTDDTQALSWPRQWVTNPDAPWGSTLYDSDEIPQRIKDATCELAFQFVNAGTTDLASLQTASEVIESTVDVLTTRYAPVSQRPQGLRRYPRIWRWIAPLLANASGQNVPLIRG